MNSIMIENRTIWLNDVFTFDYTHNGQTKQHSGRLEAIDKSKGLITVEVCENFRFKSFKTSGISYVKIEKRVSVG
jgi:hypothetical protein